MHDAISAKLRQYGYDDERAENAATIAVDALHEEYAGERMGYMPKKRAKQRQAMIEDIKTNGNVREVAEKHNVSRQTVYVYTRKQLLIR